jgi:hypothetical protein
MWVAVRNRLSRAPMRLLHTLVWWLRSSAWLLAWRVKCLGLGLACPCLPASDAESHNTSSDTLRRAILPVKFASLRAAVPAATEDSIHAFLKEGQIPWF